jgi:hypothetical protein
MVISSKWLQIYCVFEWMNRQTDKWNDKLTEGMRAGVRRQSPPLGGERWIRL